jgi:thioredoxin reductase
MELMEETPKRALAVIGGGPIGIEAALRGISLDFDVHVYERGSIGENIRRWGHVRMFSPWKMNRSSLGKRMLEEHGKRIRGKEDVCPTGDEYVRNYLLPLSRLPLLKKRLHTGMEVLSIGRETIGKNELIGNPKRAQHKFRLLMRNANGKESVLLFDIVIDATGVYGNNNWMGNGGIPAIGEQVLHGEITYTIPDILGTDKHIYEGTRTLLVGSGHSAATSLVQFSRFIKESPESSLVWVTRSENEQPYEIFPDDALPLRSELGEKANVIAANPPRNISFLPGCTVESISKRGKVFSVVVKQGDRKRTIKAENIIANVGYGPDNKIYRELQVHECWASRAPFKLAAALLGESSADCLTQKSHGADTLKNPEPNFFIIGNKSYGKNSAFLIRTGLEQIKEVYSLIPRTLEIKAGQFLYPAR